MSLDTMHKLLAAMPLIAIMRGLQPEEASSVADALLAQGVTVMETPLNAPNALDSIRALRARVGAAGLVGAGTVLTEEALHDAAAAGAQFIVAPNMDEAVIAGTKKLGLVSLPGAFTPTEAFRALRAGADGLKLFPAEMMPPEAVSALTAVLPKPLPLLCPVGGLSPEKLPAYWRAGARAFGLGGSVYKPGMRADEVGKRAAAFAASARALLSEA